MQHPAAPDLSDLVVIMAHDLKNPLAALMTNLHFLQGAVSGPDQDAVDALCDSVTLCEVLERFLRNLDLLARKREIAVRRQVVAVGAIVQEVVSRAQTQASTAGVEILLDGDAGDPPAFVDRDLLTRAVENMLANALEHSPSGSRVRVEVTAGEETVAVATTDARETLPLLQMAEDSLVPTTPATGKRIQGLYGRGLALLCADLAARATGARIEIDGAPRACRLRLVAPARE